MWSIWKCKIRIEKTRGSHVHTEPTAWGLDTQVWNLLWTKKEAVKKDMPILKKAGFESVEDLPRTSVGFRSKAYKDLQPQLRLPATSNGEQRVRVLVPNAQELHRTTQFLIQKYLNVVDWKGLELSSRERRFKFECQEIRTLPNGVGRVNWMERTSPEFPQEDIRRHGVRRHEIKSQTQAEIKRKPRWSSTAESWLEVAYWILLPTS